MLLLFFLIAVKTCRKMSIIEQYYFKKNAKHKKLKCMQFQNDCDLLLVATGNIVAALNQNSQVRKNTSICFGHPCCA